MISGIWISGYSMIAAAGIIPAVFLLCETILRSEEKENVDFRRFIAVCAAFAMAGAILLKAHEMCYRKAYESAGKKLSVKAEVLKTVEKPEKKLKMIVRIISTKPETDLKRVKAVIAVKTETERPWELTGSVIRFRSALEIPDGSRNPRCFDYRTYLKSEGIAFTGSADFVSIEKNCFDIFALIRKRLTAVREMFLNIVTDGQDEDAEALIRGTLFGDTQKMSEDMKEDFRRNGTAHVLAVSGLHIGLLYSVFRRFRKKVSFPGITSLFIVLLLAYGTMTLWTVSVTRAIVMIVILEAGNILDRRYDVPTSLGFVSMLILFKNPYELYGASFQMSFLAVLSICTVKPQLEKPAPEWVPGSLITSLSVVAGLLPYTVYNFNFIPLASFIANIPVICLMTVMATSAMVLVPPVIIMCFIPYLQGSLLRLISCARLTVTFPADLMIRINSFFGDLRTLSPDVTSPPGYIVMLAYGIMFLVTSEGFMIARKRKNYRSLSVYSLLLISMVMISVFMFSSPFDNADIVMVDVGQGDCVHLRYRDASGKVTDVMIDGGGRENYDIGKNTLKPYLLKNGAGRIELALATHLHTDHYKGLKELAAENMVKQLMIKGRAGDVIWVSGNRERYDDRIEILYPDTYDRDTEDENKNSLIFKVFINGMTMLITGDLGEEGEHTLVEKYRNTGILKCDILKVCHHGSSYSSSEEFLREVSPNVALIGVGKNNTYGHPSEEVISRLRKSGARVYRTDLDGAIGVRNKGGRLQICTMEP